MPIDFPSCNVRFSPTLLPFPQMLRLLPPLHLFWSDWLQFVPVGWRSCQKLCPSRFLHYFRIRTPPSVPLQLLPYAWQVTALKAGAFLQISMTFPSC
jgi:hypothetical protein